MATATTNIFNALSDVPQSMQLQLMALALGGNSPVSNAFTEEADSLGLTEKGRERKEREEQKRFVEGMEALREQTKRLHEQMELLEQACTEALLENEEQQRTAREGLERIRERAYEITMPDGEVVKVYRDGDLVRSEAGTEISPDILRADDIPGRSPQWSDLKAAKDRMTALSEEHRRIEEYREKLGQAREKIGRDGGTADELDKLTASLDQMPNSVRTHYRGLGGELARNTGPDQTSDPDSRSNAMRAFIKASSADKSSPPGEGNGIPEIRKPSQADVSMPAPK